MWILKRLGPSRDGGVLALHRHAHRQKDVAVSGHIAGVQFAEFVADVAGFELGTALGVVHRPVRDGGAQQGGEPPQPVGLLDVFEPVRCA